ncbi:M16 family metallopeptidase [Yinghuangia seranimata]|uniref:M16 family metallopeptidase n=1 Tax=Yinghuangia seranimata TaxID=408067 RepID=UPI00248AF6AF|nr:pitrilysin family protein [Yinghuangia seranimata]MDI2125910.1 pitrilysin family protein [Yinghuangia seranimata]
MTDTATDASTDSAPDAYPWPIHQTTLANGLRVVVSPDPAVPLAAVNLWYDVGARHEPPGKHGFAHLFEHLMFEGSAHVAKSEHFALIQACGGDSVNATTNPDRTNYYQTVPSGQLELALWLEADRMGSLALTQETLDNQREVVKNERRQRYDNVPYGRWTEVMVGLAYPEGHPYAHSTIGSMAELDSASLDDFTAFHAAYYTPDNAVLTVVGDVDPDHVVALADRYFGRLVPVGTFPAPEPPPLPRRFGAPLEVTLAEDVPMPRVFLCHRGPAWGTDDSPAVELLAAALGRGRGSRLYRTLVTERGLAQSEGGFMAAWGLMHHASMVMGACAPRVGVTPEEVAAAYADVCDEAARDGVTDAELERARTMLTADWLRELGTVNRRADLLGQYATRFGDAETVRERVARLDAVTTDDLRRVAADTFHPDNRIVLTYLPADAASGAAGAAPDEEDAA